MVTQQHFFTMAIHINNYKQPLTHVAAACGMDDRLKGCVTYRMTLTLILNKNDFVFVNNFDILIWHPATLIDSPICSLLVHWYVLLHNITNLDTINYIDWDKLSN